MKTGPSHWLAASATVVVEAAAAAVEVVVVLGQHLGVLGYRLLTVHSLVTLELVAVVGVVAAAVLPTGLCLLAVRGLAKICWAEQV